MHTRQLLAYGLIVVLVIVFSAFAYRAYLRSKAESDLRRGKRKRRK